MTLYDDLIGRENYNISDLIAYDDICFTLLRYFNDFHKKNVL
ncbi:hypothetical protein LRLP16767_LR202_00571 [Limosilactobacillus reuteri]|uniref:Uncharacterized protein n=1 Tax=Limosilactobacillus reuteri TaxID=1598 RepID=A0A0U5JRE8_LIMRT|nr:hypothetical protein LRLP16767_LR202_00571 [Limosilactobacillus reuteri]